MKKQLKNIVLYLLLPGIGIFIALFLTEIALRFTGFEFTLYPTRVQIGWPDPVTIKRRYMLDEDLLWVPKNYSDRKQLPNGAFPSLVFMGCSCTEFGRYDKYLSEIINQNFPDSGFTFVNLGVGGWSSYQGLKQLKRDIVPMRPRIITIFYGWNDHWCTFGLEDKKIGDFNLNYPKIMTALSTNFRLVQLINKSIFAMKFCGKTDTKRVSLEDFRANLKEMIRVARRNSIIPVFLTAPTSHRKGEEPAYLSKRWLKDLSKLVPLHESYVQVVRDITHQEGVYLVDLYQQFRKLPREKMEKSFGTDGIHLTEEGNKIIAHYLYEYFVQTGLIKTLVTNN